MEFSITDGIFNTQAKFVNLEMRDNLDFKISFVNTAHKVYFGSLNGNYQYIPPKTPIDYLFQGVNRRDINRCIQYFRTQPLSFQDDKNVIKGSFSSYGTMRLTLHSIKSENYE